MLNENLIQFINQTSKKLIKEYELRNNVKYDTQDFDCIVDIVNSLNGEIKYVKDSYEKLASYIICIGNNDAFTIILDDKLNQNKDLEERELFFILIGMYLSKITQNEIKSEEIIYPIDKNVNIDNILKVIDENNSKVLTKK